MSHLSRADADKLRDLVLTCRKTAKATARAVREPDEATWQAAVTADDEAFLAVMRFISAMEYGEPQS